MNKSLVTFTFAAAVFLALVSGHAETAKPSPSPAANAPAGPLTYDSFRLVRTRNVFDPDRRPVRPVTNTPPPTSSGRPDYAALTGTMLSADKTYAFFSGSRPEYNRVLTVQDRIARATITAITPQSIEIERDGKRTLVAVGQTVPLDNNSAPGVPPAEDAPAPAASVDGSVSGAAAPAATPPGSTYTPRAYPPRAGGQGNPAPAPGANPAASAAPKGPPANIEEIRRRMMEKRKQELK